MEKLKKEELDEILKKHRKFLVGESGGRKADLSGLDLANSDLFGANLAKADLSYTNLSGANLSKANLSGAVLSGAGIIEANLSNADLTSACLHDTNFHGANLSEAYLRRVEAFHTNFSYADLFGADLFGAYLFHANFTGASLSGVNLHNIHAGSEMAGIFPVCPEEGKFIGWKKALYNDEALKKFVQPCVVKLLIPHNAKRSSATTRKCRCSKAKVLDIQTLEGESIRGVVAVSIHDNSFIYKVGRTVRPDSFDEDRWAECSHGIHFFMSRAEAVEY